MNRPLLLIDVDGVISLFGFDTTAPPDGNFHVVDGIPHFLSGAAGRYLTELCEWFEPAWCTGWEEKADEHLPLALALPGRWPHLCFEGPAIGGAGHWKLEAIDQFAGPDRALAWIDDGHDGRTERWAGARRGPTLLVCTDPAIGLTAEQAGELRLWAQALALSENTGGSREATVNQVSPASPEPNTSPEVAPK